MPRRVSHEELIPPPSGYMLAQSQPAEKPFQPPGANFPATRLSVADLGKTLVRSLATDDRQSLQQKDVGIALGDRGQDRPPIG
jgi:hypothetical protein